MLIPVLIGDDIYAAAMVDARKIGTTVTRTGDNMNAPLATELTHWIDKIWDQSEAAISYARQKGLAAAQPFITKVGELADEAGVALKQKAEAVLDIVRQRLDAFIQGAIDRALTQIRPAIGIGGQQMSVAKVSVEMRLMFSTSLKASLEGICELVAEGELTVASEYTLKA